MNRMSAQFQSNGNLFLREPSQQQVEHAALSHGQGSIRGGRGCRMLLLEFNRFTRLDLCEVASGKSPDDQTHAAKTDSLTENELTGLDWLLVDEGPIPAIEIANRDGRSVDQQLRVSPRHGRIVEHDVTTDGSPDGMSSLVESDSNGSCGFGALQQDDRFQAIHGPPLIFRI
jgi:hypothetical protein